jgi:hypothetical protein
VSKSPQAAAHHGDTIPTVLHYDGANNGTHTGTDGVRDVFVIDAKHLVAGFDWLLNWDRGEDVIAISNYAGKLKDVGITKPYDDMTALLITGESTDALIPEVTVKGVKSMIVFDDPFAFM